MIKIIIYCFFISISCAQIFSHYDYVGSKSISMSGSITSGPGGTWSIFHNPSQLADLHHLQVVSGYSEIFGLSFLPYYHAGFLYKGWAINMEQLSTSIYDIELSSETAIGLSKGIYIQKDKNSSISLGSRFNFYYYDLGKSAGVTGDGELGSELGSDFAFGIDLGLQASLKGRHYFAVYYQNINNPMIGMGFGGELPRSLSMGISYYPYEALLTSLDINQLIGSDSQQVRFGIEYHLFNNFILRTGVQNNSSRFSGGFVLSLQTLNIEYGFITHHIMPITHQVSISFWLNK